MAEEPSRPPKAKTGNFDLRVVIHNPRPVPRFLDIDLSGHCPNLRVGSKRTILGTPNISHVSME